MESPIYLVTGGAKSGKSEFAERLLVKFPGQLGYIATAQILDKEIEYRVAQHRLRRPDCWNEYEVPYDLPAVLPEILAENEAVLLDCLTLYTSNYLFKHESEGLEELMAGYTEHIESIIKAALAAQGARLIIVTNELGSGIVPMDPLTRNYRDMVGKANQMIADAAKEVYLTVSGITIELKKRSCTM